MSNATPTPSPTGTATAVPSPTPTAIPGTLAGDANCDGAITAADLPALEMALAAGDPQACGADVDCNGTLDQRDVNTLIAELYSGMLLPPCEKQVQP